MLTRKTMWIAWLAISIVSALLIDRTALGQTAADKPQPKVVISRAEKTQPTVVIPQAVPGPYGALPYSSTVRDAYPPRARRRAVVDPEMRKLLEQDAKMEKQAADLVQNFRGGPGDVDDVAEWQAKVRAELERLTEKHFELRQKRRELEISRLEDQLKRVRESLKKRNDAKEMIIKRRVSKLLGEQDDLVF